VHHHRIPDVPAIECPDLLAYLRRFPARDRIRILGECCDQLMEAMA